MEALGRRQVDERGVDLPDREGGGLLDQVKDVEVHLQAGVQGGERGDHPAGGGQGGGAVGQPEAQGQPVAVGGRVACGDAQFVRRVDHVPDEWKQGMPEGRQRHFPARPGEQLHPQPTFEGADLLTEGGLGQVEPCGGAAEMQLLGQRQQ